MQIGTREKACLITTAADRAVVRLLSHEGTCRRVDGTPFDRLPIFRRSMAVHPPTCVDASRTQPSPDRLPDGRFAPGHKAKRSPSIELIRHARRQLRADDIIMAITVARQLVADPMADTSLRLKAAGLILSVAKPVRRTT